MGQKWLISWCLPASMHHGAVDSTAWSCLGILAPPWLEASKHWHCWQSPKQDCWILVVLALQLPSSIHTSLQVWNERFAKHDRHMQSNPLRKLTSELQFATKHLWEIRKVPNPMAWRACLAWPAANSDRAKMQAFWVAQCVSHQSIARCGSPRMLVP